MVARMWLCLPLSVVFVWLPMGVDEVHAIGVRANGVDDAVGDGVCVR